MEDFLAFLLTKVYLHKDIPKKYIQVAFDETVLDVNFHYPKISKDDIKKRIQTNSNELAVFLFRLGSELHKNNMDELTPQIHWLLKEICSCEIYFNTLIDEGFYIVHGEGTIIGSRNSIGKGFKIHQGCTIGHKKNGEGNGNKIGNNVTMYCNSSIIGDLKIGDNVIIGAHVMVCKDLNHNDIVVNNTEIRIKSR